MRSLEESEDQKNAMAVNTSSRWALLIFNSFFTIRSLWLLLNIKTYQEYYSDILGDEPLPGLTLVFLAQNQIILLSYIMLNVGFLFLVLRGSNKIWQLPLLSVVALLNYVFFELLVMAIQAPMMSIFRKLI